MIIYPAIDLKNQKCVRLYQGDFAKETIYHTDPIEFMQTFADAGASWMHIVDLDGANDPKQTQSVFIANILNQKKIKIQTGGGVRTKKQVKALLDAGAERVIIGSLAVTHSTEVCDWLHYFGNERIVLALDIAFNENNQPMVSINGWKEYSSHSLFDLIQFYQTSALKHILCTNIKLDGTLQGPDFALYDLMLKQFSNLHIQASGGIHALSDITRLKEMGVAGTIIGRALFEKKFTLAEALSC